LQMEGLVELHGFRV